MSITSKIRERSGLAVAIVALGLILFLVGGDILGPNSVILSGFRQKIGEIDGQKVTATDFQEQIARTEYEYQIQNNKAPTAEEQNQLRDQAWNQIFFDRVNREEFDKLGLGVPENEQVDMVQGKNIHSAIKQAFTNPQTGEFDKAQIQNFLKNINRAQPQQQAAWLNFERKLPEDRLRTKYEALLTKTNYVTRLEAMHDYTAANTKADIQYVFVNFNTIPDSTIKVEDAELQAFLSENPNRYKVQDNRGIEYVQWVIKPSAEDSGVFRKELEGIRTDFMTAQNDTQFAASVSDAPAKLQVLSADQLPAELSPMASSLQTGQVYGPFAQGNTITLYKVVSAGNEGEPAVKASHILFGIGDKSDTAKASARAKANNVLNQIKGGTPFELMAQIHGTDGTKDKGGDLGWWTKGKMVKPFDDAVFAHPTVGLLPNLVETDFGYHIIKVTAPPTNMKYKVVMVQKNITAGDQTREDLYAKANQFKGAVADQAAFEAELKKENLKKENAASVYKNGNSVNDIPEAREIVKWAYSDDAKLGEVSRVFELTDRYVVAVLTKVSEEGQAKVEDVREALTAEVRKKKKAEQIISKLGTGSLEQMKQKYGDQAVLNTQTDVFLNTNGVGDFGYDPVLVGTIFGMKVNATTKPIQAESGVAVVKVTKKTDAPAVDKNYDVSSYKTQIEQRNQGRVQYYINEALKEITKTKDNRVRYF